MSVVDDLASHAADRVWQVLLDVTALEANPADQAKIALMAASVCIGQAAAHLSRAARLRGDVLNKKDAMLGAIELMRKDIADGTEAISE